MEGHHGPLEITDFVELVHRNKYRPNIRFFSTRWGARQGAPPNTCTMLVGAWTPVHETYLNPEHVNAYNVNTPFMPEFSVSNAREYVTARGWRSLLTELILHRVIRPSPELERLLGYRDFHSATRGLGCF